jgi:hypothetical protein
MLTTMKTKNRKILSVHGYTKCCANCDYYIYEDQDYITINTTSNSQQWFHKDHTGCRESQFPAVIGAHVRKQGSDND